MSIVKPNEPKMLTGSGQKARSRVFRCTHGTHGHSRLPVWKAGANSFVSLELNMANPTSRLRVEAGASARNADGMAGRGCWKKRRPFCNGADRELQHHSRRANGQTSSGSFVTRKLAEPSQEEIANERGSIRVCILRPSGTRGTRLTGLNVNVKSAGCKRVSSRQHRKSAGAR